MAELQQAFVEACDEVRIKDAEIAQRDNEIAALRTEVEARSHEAIAGPGGNPQGVS